MVPSGALTRHVGIAKVHPGPRIALEPGHDAHEDKEEREKALAALRQEIPDFDDRVEDERRKARNRQTEAEKPRGAPPGNQNAAKGEGNKDANSTIVSPKTKGSTKSETIIARLKRDAATNTHAAALLGSIEALLRLLVPPGASWPG